MPEVYGLTVLLAGVGVCSDRTVSAAIETTAPRSIGLQEPLPAATTLEVVPVPVEVEVAVPLKPDRRTVVER
jgi:hypothetical protein